MTRRFAAAEAESKCEALRRLEECLARSPVYARMRECYELGFLAR